MSRNISAIISKVIENEQIKEAMQYLKNDEQVGFATVLLGCQLTKEELPQIPDNDRAKNVVVISINPVKNEIGIKYEALKERRYKDGEYRWIDLEEPSIAYDAISYATYLDYADKGYKG